MIHIEIEIGKDVMITTGKYTSFIATIKKISECGRFAYVNLDMTPEREIKKLRFKIENLIRYRH